MSFQHFCLNVAESGFFKCSTSFLLTLSCRFFHTLSLSNSDSLKDCAAFILSLNVTGKHSIEKVKLMI